MTTPEFLHLQRLAEKDAAYLRDLQARRAKERAEASQRAVDARRAKAAKARKS